MNNLQRWAAIAVLFFAVSNTHALGPQECVLLVNRTSMQSVELANYYADLRQIPAVNIIHLDLPDKAREAEASFTLAEFNEFIRDPVLKALRERKIVGHIITWLYSVDFPTTVETSPPMSLTGITFTRGEPPPSDQITSGEWLSPMFAGPDRPDGPASPPSSMENFTIALTNRMPFPSMMLGWSGSRGMTIEEIIQQLKSSAASDGAQPSASTYFEINDDVRTQTRAWQFAPVTRELAALGVAAFTASNPPPDRADVMGVLAGRPSIDPATYGMLKPGSYADHLTSFAGVFHDPNQTKLSVWLRRGAAGSSGTITEPGSLTVPVRLWAKFPSARLFTHYASGCTLAESLFLATRCPLQILFVGDALCNPWAKPPGLTLINMADDEKKPIVGKAEFLASSWGGFGQAPPSTIFFLDGRPVGHSGSNPNLPIDTSKLYDGYHELRVVAYAQERVRHQGTDTIGFFSRNRNRSSSLGGYTDRQKVDLYRPLTFTVTAEGNPREAAIIAQERVIARAPYTTNMTLSFHPMLVGAGPVSFQVVAVYPDNEPVRSAPLVLHITPMNQSPVIHHITIATNDNNERILSFAANDPENDPLTLLWYCDLIAKMNVPKVASPETMAQLEMADGHLVFASTNTPVCAVYEVDHTKRVKEMMAILQFAAGGTIVNRHHAGLVFNYLDENNYMFWGLDGQRSAWVLMRKQDGVEKSVFSRGAPIDLRKEYRLLAIALGTQKIAFFVNDNLQGVVDLAFGAGKLGVRSGSAPVHFKHLHVSPPAAVHGYFEDAGADIRVGPEQAANVDALFAAARDMQFTALKPVREAAAETKPEHQ